MRSATDNSNAPLSIIAMLTVLLVATKLGHLIGWSWWIVLLPFWGTVVLIALTLMLGLTLIAVGEWMKERAT